MAPVLKRDHVVVESGPRRPHAAAPTHGTAAAKSARLIVVGGEVRGIEFTCDCGERSVIELEFDGRREGGKES
jgi:hypothetical protein